MAYDKRSSYFEKQRPRDQMKKDFANLWRFIVTAQSSFPLYPQHQRECARNQQQIAKVSVKKPRREERLQAEPIHNVGRAAD
jgi:hypothetical protein